MRVRRAAEGRCEAAAREEKATFFRRSSQAGAAVWQSRQKQCVTWRVGRVRRQAVRQSRAQRCGAVCSGARICLEAFCRVSER